jgi:hypothetical protein
VAMLGLLPLRCVGPTTAVLTSVTNELLRRRLLLRSRDSLRCLHRFSTSDFAPRGPVLTELLSQVKADPVDAFSRASLTKLRLMHDTLARFPHGDSGKDELVAMLMEHLMTLDLVQHHAEHLGLLWAMSARVQSFPAMRALVAKLRETGRPLTGSDARFTLDAIFVSPEKNNAKQLLRQEELVEVIVAELEARGGDTDEILRVSGGGGFSATSMFNLKIAAAVLALHEMSQNGDGGPSQQQRTISRLEERVEAILRRSSSPAMTTFGHADVKFAIPTIWAAMASPRLLPLLSKAVENDLVDVVLRSEGAYQVAALLRELRPPQSTLGKELLSRSVMGTMEQLAASRAPVLPWCTLFVSACHLNEIDASRKIKARIEQILASPQTVLSASAAPSRSAGGSPGAPPRTAITNPALAALLAGAGTSCGQLIGPFDKCVVVPRGTLSEIASSKTVAYLLQHRSVATQHDLEDELVEILSGPECRWLARDDALAAVEAHREKRIVLSESVVERLAIQAERTPARIKGHN